MANNTDPNNKDLNKKRPGEKEPGTFHYNPGNMSGKTSEIPEDAAEQENNAERIRARHEHVQKR